MTNPPSIDKNKLRKFIRQLDSADHLVLWDRALEMIPEAQFAALIRDYARPEQLQQDSTPPETLLNETKRFYQDSLAGKYYQHSNHHDYYSRNESKETQVWMAECIRLFDGCVAATKAGELVSAREALDLLFDLLRQLDECEVEIIAFADEGGSSEVDVDWNAVLPAWFQCVSVITTPHEYAQMVRKIIQEFAPDQTEALLKVAAQVGTEEQRVALVR